MDLLEWAKRVVHLPYKDLNYLSVTLPIAGIGIVSVGIPLLLLAITTTLLCTPKGFPKCSICFRMAYFIFYIILFFCIGPIICFLLVFPTWGNFWTGFVVISFVWSLALVYVFRRQPEDTLDINPDADSIVDDIITEEEISAQSRSFFSSNETRVGESRSLLKSNVSIDNSDSLNYNNNETEYLKILSRPSSSSTADEQQLQNKKYNQESKIRRLLSCCRGGGGILSSLSAIADTIKKHFFLFIFLEIFLIFTAFLINFVTCETCLAYFPHPELQQGQDVFHFSTFFYRKVLSMNRQCVWNEICYSYLTVPEDLRSEMIVNFNWYGSSPISRANVTLLSTAPGQQPYMRIVNASCQGIPIEESRYQCWADLTNLQPSSVYEVYASFNDKRGNLLKFRTAPSSPEESITFVSGGDLVWNNESFFLASLAAKAEPLFAIVGGDVAYENGDINCYLIYDLWFKTWNSLMVTPSNFTIPILTAVGNHEAGGFQLSRQHNQLYLRFFPHQIGFLEEDDPIQNRPLNHFHIICNHSAIIVLDSWVHTHPKDQVSWIENALANMTGIRNKFAVYHAAIVPYRGQLTPNVVEYYITNALLEYWMPLFDKFSLVAAFENHYHAYKRTYPIRNGTAVIHGQIGKTNAIRAENVPKDGIAGTLYLGDGQWGAPSTAHPYSNNTWILEHGLFSHLFLAKTSKNIVNFSVITEPMDIKIEDFSN